MRKVSTTTLFAAMLAMAMASNLQAEEISAATSSADEQPVAVTAAEGDGTTQADEPGLEPGLDRERADHRAQTLEQRRLEEDERRKGAGLDRERSRQRAEKLEDRRE